MYGGCRGNENNFKTRRQCADACSNSESENQKSSLIKLFSFKIEIAPENTFETF